MNASSVRLRSPEFRDGQVGGSLLQRGQWFNKIRGPTANVGFAVR